MELVTGLLGILLVVALLLLGREIACWYLKINSRLDEQKRTNALLVALLEAQGVGREVVSQAVGDPYAALERPVSEDSTDTNSMAYKLGRAVSKVGKKS